MARKPGLRLLSGSEQADALPLAAWLDDLEPHTKRLYAAALRQLGLYLRREGSADDANDALLEAGCFFASASRLNANEKVGEWLRSLAAVEQKTGVPRYTTATIRTRLAAVRWLAREARRKGKLDWTLDVALPKPEKDAKTGRLKAKPGRKTKGPPLEKVREIIDAAAERGDEGVALIGVRLLFVEALRAHEVRQLDLADVDLRQRTLAVVRKKREEPEDVPLSKGTARAIKKWLRFRGEAAGALLWGGHGREVVEGQRLSHAGLDYIVRELGRACGVVPLSSHGLRHSSLTLGQEVREQLGIPIQQAMRRAGHRSLAAHERYLDTDVKQVRRLTEGVSELLG